MPGPELNLDRDERINLGQAAVMLLQAPAPPRNVLAAIFQGFGVHQPVQCHDVETALTRARTLEPLDLIVCDADTDGQAYDFVRRLRTTAPPPNRFCPVILLSGLTQLGQVKQARDCGANFVVTKPLKAMVLLERIFWMSADKRLFFELEGYAGPDRRSQFIDPPPGARGRRATDKAKAGDDQTRNLTQAEIDRYMRALRKAA